MKKIISAFLILTMLFSVTAVSASADGALQVHADMSSNEAFTSVFAPGLFFIEEEGLLYGYSEAKALQTIDDISDWYVYDTSCEVAFADDELSDAERAFSFWYCNINLQAYGRYEGTNYMRLMYDIENQEFTLNANDPETEEPVILAGPVPYELEDGEFYTIGMSVSEKRIRGFIGDEMIIDYYDEADDYLIGRQDENTYGVPLVWWNDGNFIQFRDIKIATPGYLYPFEMTIDPEVTTTEDPAVSTDEADNTGVSTSVNTLHPDDETTTTTASEATTRIESSVVVKEDGETEIVTEIITESTAPAPAATNTGKPAGGNATATGDSTFVVVAAMVATLGCALIVRKVNVR